MTSPPDVTIVGAGLAGSLLATMLARRGMRVSVYEKRPDMRRHDVSAGRSINLALAERGIHALKKAGVFDQIESQLVPMRGRMLHTPDGSTELQPYGSRPDEVFYSVSRGDLTKLMMTAAESYDGVTIQFDSRCVGADLAGKRLLLAEGEEEGTGSEQDKSGTQEIEYHRLVGADGAGSPVRTAIIKATAGATTIDRLEHCYKELCIPAGQGGSFQMDRNALHIWPRGGFMLIALPNSDGSFTLTLFLSAEGSPSFAELERVGDIRSFFEAHFADALELIPDLASDFANNPTGQLATVRCAPWNYEESALILGDAAHAVVPFHGQGMNCAFEDCAQLMHALDNNESDKKGEWGALFSEFSQTRKPAADAIADMAIENYHVMRDQVRDPKFHLKKRLEFELERQFPTRFIPRYSMVMFHRIPYDVAYARGERQTALLNELLQNAETLEQVDMQRAEQLVIDCMGELS